MSQVNGVGGRPAILVEGLTKSFGEVHALRGIDLEVPRGTVLGVLGPNGAGKTTAVRILTTLLPPDRGRALVEGIDVVRRAGHAGRQPGEAHRPGDPGVLGPAVPPAEVGGPGPGHRVAGALRTGRSR